MGVMMGGSEGERKSDSLVLGYQSLCLAQCSVGTSWRMYFFHYRSHSLADFILACSPRRAQSNGRERVSDKRETFN